MSTQKISCDHCGAPLRYSSGEIVVTCPYCGYTVVIDVGKPFTLEHALLPSNFNEKKAINLVKSWMKSSFIAPTGLALRAKFTDVQLYFLPFWIIPLTATSKYRGLFERMGPRIEKKGTINKRYNWVIFTQRRTEFPTREFNIPLEGRMPYDFRKIPEGAKVLNSEIGENEAIEIAKQQIKNDHQFLAEQEVDKIIEIETAFKIDDAYYLHAPVWIMRYKFKGKNYQVLLDGSKGEVIKGDIPTDSLF
jgi:DNA-directed RNA polymerase subunit RPC12/RpoP